MSAAKYARAERDLRAARPVGAAAKAFYDNAEVRDRKEKNRTRVPRSDRRSAGLLSFRMDNIYLESNIWHLPEFEKKKNAGFCIQIKATKCKLQSVIGVKQQ